MAELQRWIEDLNLSNPDGDDEIRDGETQGLLKAVPSTYINKKQQDIKTADEWFTWIKPFITIPILRKAAGGVSTFSADSVGISVSSRHADDSAALSMAIAKASDHLNQILRDGAVDDEYSVELYLHKVQALPNSTLPRNSLQTFIPDAYQQSLINVAFSAARGVYHISNDNQSLVCRPGGDNKACSMIVDLVEDRQLITVSIRGTSGLSDWMVDTNGDPEPHANLLNGASRWHRGILRVAQHMEKAVAEAVMKIRSSVEHIHGILFTGHSLGGAIAQIFYAACHAQDMKLAKSTYGMDEIHCVTFAAPPVSTIPFQTLSSPGYFIAIINEGDPVVLAQDNYLRNLISVYALSSELYKKKFGKVIVPSPELRVCGNCIVLIDQNPDDIEERFVQAVQAEGAFIESRLFGNPFLHMAEEYGNMLEAWQAGLVTYNPTQSPVQRKQHVKRAKR